MPKPIETLKLQYPMIQFLINKDMSWSRVLCCIIFTLSTHKRAHGTRLTTGRRGKLLKLPTCVVASVSRCLSCASQLLFCTKFQLFLGHLSWTLYEVEWSKWPFVCLRGRRAWDIAQPMSRFPSPRPSAKRGPGRSLVRSRILLHWWVGGWLNVEDKSEKPLAR